MYTQISQVPPRRQWEPNSAPNKPFNCGPASASFVADFMRDAVFGIEETRDLAHLADGDGTSGQEQAVMLTKRGVPATVQQPTAAQLTALVQSGTRPVIIGMLMSIVPAAVRGHSFPGVHAVVVRENAVVNGIPGKLIMDPNFGYGQTVDGQNGARFYPDSVIEAARSGAGANRNAVVPTNPKAVGADVTILVDAVKFLGADGKPANRSIGFAAGVTVVGYALDGTSEPFKAGAGGSSAPADARCTITRTDNAAPKGSGWVRIVAGVFADHPYLAEAQAGLTVAPDPPPPTTGVPPADVAKAVAEAKAAGIAEGKVEGAVERDQAWEAKIAASHHP